MLLAYAKLTLYDQLLPSDLPDDPAMVDDLLRYFPTPIREQYREPVMRHRLRREIVATVVTNSMVNRVGATFVNDMGERSGAAPHTIARAYLVARQVFDLRALWAGIEALDNKVAGGGAVPHAARDAAPARSRGAVVRAAEQRASSTSRRRPSGSRPASRRSTPPWTRCSIRRARAELAAHGQAP